MDIAVRSLVLTSTLSILHPPVYAVHHAVTRDKFFKMVAGPDFDGVRGATDFLVDELRKVEKVIEECHALKLPLSWIHGDAQCVPVRSTPFRGSTRLTSYTRLK
jgi:hypothetical protein